YTLQAEQVSGGAPAEYLYRTLTLTVANPDLTPNSVVAAGAVSAASLAATGNATIGGTAGVTGALTASGGANVRGGLSTDTLNASGAISAGSAGISGAISANSLSVNGATVNQLNAGGANISGGLAAGSITSGWTSLAPAPDYSQGCVGIGGTSYNNYLVTVTNMQNYGMGVFINAPNLSDSWWALDVHGQCINSSGSWSQISDERLKENIQPFSDGLAKVLRIDPVRYRYKADTGIGPDKEYVSVLAQSLKKTAPYMVGKSRLKPDSRKEYLCIDSGPLTYMLINAVKELHAEIEGLKRSKGKSAKG
ncbi:MAG: tail fiber domain-containing protein, partial [Allosphingosinicella sp.]